MSHKGSKSAWLQGAGRRRALYLCCTFVVLLLSASKMQSESTKSAVEGDPGSLVAKTERFLSLLEQEEFDEARALMTESPRLWWNEREGEGGPWTIGAQKKGPWKNWDLEFRTQSELLEWREDARSATRVIRETNDYFRLLERGWVTTELVYYFDETGQLEGRLIRAAGERPPGLTEEFVDWATANEPAELSELMPDGEVDPSGDHPRRFRDLLNRWRSATNRDPIE